MSCGRKIGPYDCCSVVYGDCLELMKALPDRCVDAVITDPPYGTTSNKWDAVIPFAPMWEQTARVAKESAVFVFTASQPFTSALVMSKPEWFRHEWIWIKNRGSNFANTVREPFKEHESVVVFSRGGWTYNPKMQERTGAGTDRILYDFNFRSQSKNYHEFEGREGVELGDMRVPSSWQKFNTETGLHPTQKPVALMSYLVETYTNASDTVLDICCGSGTLAIAALKFDRHSLSFENDRESYEVARDRIARVEAQPSLFDPKVEQVCMFEVEP